MKYFTEKLCCEVNDPDPEIVSRAKQAWDRNINLYQAQLGQILRHFSDRNKHFWTDYVYRLHDGAVVRIAVGDAMDVNVLKELPKSWHTTALIEVVDWDSNRLCILKYRLVDEIDARFRDGLGHSTGTMFEHWGYSELTQEGDGAFRHSILFSTGSEISIVFRRFSYTRRKLSGKS